MSVFSRLVEIVRPRCALPFLALAALLGLGPKAPAQDEIFGLNVLATTQPAPVRAFTYPEGEYGPAELRYINGLPVLQVQGTAEQIGSQIGHLAVRPAPRVVNYPRDCLKLLGLDFFWPTAIGLGQKMMPNFPQRYRHEIESLARASGHELDVFVAGNTLFDIKKFFGCSTVYVSGERSATGQPMLGRNLDFPTLGYLNDYTLVTVYRPEGKIPWASVGFPGAVGCLSGMNAAGLTVNVLEVYSAADGGSRFELQGTPYAMCYRRVLEECRTIDEAAELLKGMTRTTSTNLAVADRTGGAVFEITTRHIEVRRAEANGILPATNHFRSEGLRTESSCYRYDILKQTGVTGPVTLGEVARKLHQVNQGGLTLQTMVWEPKALRLHLAIGPCPTSALPLRTLDLAPLLHPAPVATAHARD